MADFIEWNSKEQEDRDREILYYKFLSSSYFILIPVLGVFKDIIANDTILFSISAVVVGCGLLCLWRSQQEKADHPYYSRKAFEFYVALNETSPIEQYDITPEKWRENFTQTATTLEVSLKQLFQSIDSELYSNISVSSNLMIYYSSEFSEEDISRILEYSNAKADEPYNPVSGADHYSGKESIFGRLLLVGLGGYDRPEEYKSIYLNVAKKIENVLPIAPKIAFQIIKNGFTVRDNLFKSIGHYARYYSNLKDLDRNAFHKRFDDVSIKTKEYVEENDHITLFDPPSERVINYFNEIGETITGIISIPIIDKDEFIGVLNIELIKDGLVIDKRVRNFIIFIMCNISYVFANHAIIYKRMIERNLLKCEVEKEAISSHVSSKPEEELPSTSKQEEE
ncbi:hypothetical protein [Gracilimonas sediminicola]|uniref:Uncharacterized protein n=1 Tax=Gracilimonas sediminicola TaxID=2952158 RepID=A0A9X2RBU4_9BACT|nr:hypothetical protein [Gracilimonas sediminicola]MCP9290545.1 hypothetical protein [Gracilimonas sediminicola]